MIPRLLSLLFCLTLTQTALSAERPFSRELIKAIGDRGQLVDEVTAQQLYEQQDAREKKWAEDAAGRGRSKER